VAEAVVPFQPIGPMTSVPIAAIPEEVKKKLRASYRAADIRRRVREAGMTRSVYRAAKLRLALIDSLVAERYPDDLANARRSHYASA
jgi:hypothetical protein